MGVYVSGSTLFELSVRPHGETICLSVRFVLTWAGFHKRHAMRRKLNFPRCKLQLLCNSLGNYFSKNERASTHLLLSTHPCIAWQHVDSSSSSRSARRWRVWALSSHGAVADGTFCGIIWWQITFMGQELFLWDGWARRKRGRDRGRGEAGRRGLRLPVLLTRSLSTPATWWESMWGNIWGILPLLVWLVSVFFSIYKRRSLC